MPHRLSPLLLAACTVLVFSSHAAAMGAPEQTDPQPIQYRVERGPLRDLAARFTPNELSLLEKLNRADIAHLSRLARIAVPLEFRDELAHSPFPADYAVAAAMAKLLVVDQPAQAFAAYEHGHLVRWGPVSSGRQARPTPGGRFHLNWRARSRLSTVSGDWRLNWYFNFHNTRGLAFHEFDLPGVPASHACIRLLARDAEWIYQWGESWVLDPNGQLLEPGTPVVIVGQYVFGSEKPWLAHGPARTLALPAAIPEQD